ncbi:MAG: BlaI/MecI/CopY family transcriptional regulator [Ilumatobacteraceae bacterium]
MTKRPDGALEHDILSVLWAVDDPLQPAEVKSRLGSELAYTTVATVLGRLHDKGLVERLPSGRAFAYRAVLDEAQLAARRIDDVLSTANDRAAVLARFVGTLSKRDVKALRKLLDDGRP